MLKFRKRKEKLGTQLECGRHAGQPICISDAQIFQFLRLNIFRGTNEYALGCGCNGL